MKELFERLVRTFPKDSDWYATMENGLVGFQLYSKKGGDRCKIIEGKPDWWNAAALTIIRQELVKSAGHSVKVTLLRNGRAYAALYLGDGEWTSGNGDSEMEAILRVAVEAFEPASKGEGLP